jgi:subtilisin family serine protease
MSKVNGQTVSSVSYLIKAMADAVDTYDCDIINISMGVTDSDCESVLNSAAQYAINKGVIVISSAGNSGDNSDSSVASALSYPASLKGVISVGATDSAYNRAAYSQKNERVDVVAYGGTLHLASNTSNNGYSTGKGTSFSAPVITGITALFISNHNVSPADYSRILKAAAVDIGELGNGDYMGYGMPDCMAMEDVYTYNADVYISNVYEKSDGTVNVKVASSGSVDTAQLVVASFKDGCMDSYTLYDLSFTDDFAYVSLPSMPQSGARMFVINNLSGLESLSDVVEY